MRKLADNVFAVGVIDWDRRLFDELIPLPDGTTYNAYVIKGSEKTALVDSVDPAMTEQLIGNLVKHGVDKIDYVISHHAEQDHSGSIPDILTLYPDAQVITGKKCKDMLISLLHIEEERITVVENGETLSLGDKTLQFLATPWVHWPETFSSYLQEDKILFSCDFFGSHFASSSLFVDDESKVREAAKRYYAEIMMPFRKTISRNLEAVDNLDIKMIAPSHGPVYDNPPMIIDAYKEWVSEPVKNEVLIAYVSMHDSTRLMVEHLVEALIERGVGVKQFNLSDYDTGELAISLVDVATVILGSSTVLAGAHPAAAYAAVLVNALRPKAKFLSIIGSYGWGGRMVDQLKACIPNLRVDLIEPVMIKGCPRDDDFLELDKLADSIYEKHREIGIAD